MSLFDRLTIWFQSIITATFNLFFAKKKAVFSKKKAAFTIHNLIEGGSAANSVDMPSLLDVFRENSTPIPISSTSTPGLEIVCLGWFIKLPKKENRVESLFEPVSIQQLLLVTFLNGSQRQVLTFLLGDVKLSLTTNLNALIPNYDIFAINEKTLPGEEYHNYLESDPNLKMPEAEYHLEETELVYFSRTQMKLIDLYVNDPMLYPVGTMDVLFSGYEVKIGRVTGDLSMMELQGLFHSDPEREWDEWFSLKAEIIPQSKLTEGVARNINFTSNRPEPDDIDECLNSLEESGIPLAFLGQPCPPVWFIVQEMLKEISGLYGNINLNELACAIKETLKSTVPAYKEIAELENAIDDRIRERGGDDPNRPRERTNVKINLID